tara:strand:- start:966 stop:2180 length:1215 start_codon:yes stop_codon:yes gene_type:complete
MDYSLHDNQILRYDDTPSLLRRLARNGLLKCPVCKKEVRFAERGRNYFFHKKGEGTAQCELYHGSLNLPVIPAVNVKPSKKQNQRGVAPPTSKNSNLNVEIIFKERKDNRYGFLLALSWENSIAGDSFQLKINKSSSVIIKSDSFRVTGSYLVDLYELEIIPNRKSSAELIKQVDFINNFFERHNYLIFNNDDQSTCNLNDEFLIEEVKTLFDLKSSKIIRNLETTDIESTLADDGYIKINDSHKIKVSSPNIYKVGENGAKLYSTCLDNVFIENNAPTTNRITINSYSLDKGMLLEKILFLHPGRTKLEDFDESTDFIVLEITDEKIIIIRSTEGMHEHKVIPSGKFIHYLPIELEKLPHLTQITRNQSYWEIVSIKEDNNSSIFSYKQWNSELITLGYFKEI